MRFGGTSTGASEGQAQSLDLRPRSSFPRTLGQFARRKPLGAAGFTIAALLILIAILANVMTTKEPTATSANTIQAPGKAHWLGTDELGRDVYTRLVYGSRISLRVGFTAVAIGVTLGFILGLTSAYLGGTFDLLVQRIVDAILAFPGLVLILAIITILEPSINNVIAALSFGLIPRTSRTIRSQALSIKETDYVLAARAVGAGTWRIMLRHMAPNCLAIYIVFATFSLGFAIIAEASLSFLGLGGASEHSDLGRDVEPGGGNGTRRGALAGSLPWPRLGDRRIRLELDGRRTAGRIGPTPSRVPVGCGKTQEMRLIHADKTITDRTF